jgi:hypothetical protein
MQGIIVALSASAVAFAVLYLVLTRRIRKQVDPEAILGQIRKEVEELIVELNHTTERNISLMEEKLATLSATIEGAEKRLAVLRREASALEKTERAYAALRAPPAAQPVASRAAQVRDSRASPSGGSRAARRGARPSRVTAEPKPPPPADGGAEEADVRTVIVGLHRAGISAESIARRVNVPRAKVELIVSLEEGGSP